MALADGTRTLAYCANSGSLAGCLQTGSPALLWDSGDSRRKRRYTLRAVELKGFWIGTDTNFSNLLAEETLRQRLIPGLSNHETLERERLIEKGLRVDFVLTGPEGRCFVEVKSATVVEEGVARFPDSVTPRSVKQLEWLARRAAAGERSVMLYVVQRGDAEAFTINWKHSPAYAEAFKEAFAAGVEVFALAAGVRAQGFERPRLLPFRY
jgi:sugar fermentation stimulation protein A